MQVRYTKKLRRRLRLVGGLFLLSISSWGLGIERGTQQLAAAVDQSPSLQTDAAPRKPAKKEGAVTTVAALSSSPSAAPSSTGDAKPTSKPKSRASARGPYYVDFRARTAASYGHAFVWYGKTSARKVEVAGYRSRRLTPLYAGTSDVGSRQNRRELWRSRRPVSHRELSGLFE